MGVVVDSGTDTVPSATVGPGGAVNAGTVAGPEVGANVATGAELDVVSTVGADIEAGRTSVGLVTQAKIPIMVATMGKTSSRDIPDYPKPFERAEQFFRVIWYRTEAYWTRNEGYPPVGYRYWYENCTGCGFL